ncbi:MAG: DUF1552 domain-containing protein [Planctomycetota bacterium]
MARKSWQLNRRDLLKGAGVALALPYLNAMAPSKAMAASATKEMPKRFLGTYISYGVYQPEGPTGIPRKNEDGTYQHHEWSWWPQGEPGELKSFNKSTAPFEKFKGDITYLRGLDHKGGWKLGGHSSGDVFLTGADMAEVETTNNISIDQVMANHHGHKTRHASLVMGTEGGTGSYLRTKTMSHRGPGKAIPSMHKPDEIFNRMFNPYGNKGVDQVRAELERDASILDLMMDHSKSFHNRLGKEDQRKMDEYLESVREIEKRVKRTDDWTHEPLPDVDRDSVNLTVDHQSGPHEYIRTLYDLAYLAFITDQTRYATFMTESEQSQSSELWNYANYVLGYKGATHDIAHKRPQVISGQWDLWRAQNHAYFLERLANTQEGEGTMLDNTLCLWGSAHPHASHSGFNYPLQLAGGKNMGFKHGSLHEWVGDKKVPMANLFVTMLQAMGIPMTKFADSTGTLPELMG